MTSPVYGFLNTIESQQTPKGRCGNDRDHEARPPSLTKSSNSAYRWNSALREHGGVGDDSGRINERKAWRCTDCGVEREPQSDTWECCSRCGSTDEPTWR